MFGFFIKAFLNLVIACLAGAWKFCYMGARKNGARVRGTLVSTSRAPFSLAPITSKHLLGRVTQ